MVLKMEEQMETTNLTKEQLATDHTLSKYEGLGSAMVAVLMIGFWFGVGVILSIWMVKSLLLLKKCQNKLRYNK